MVQSHNGVKKFLTLILGTNLYSSGRTFSSIYKDKIKNEKKRKKEEGEKVDVRGVFSFFMFGRKEKIYHESDSSSLEKKHRRYLSLIFSLPFHNFFLFSSFTILIIIPDFYWPTSS